MTKTATWEVFKSMLETVFFPVYLLYVVKIEAQPVLLATIKWTLNTLIRELYAGMSRLQNNLPHALNGLLNAPRRRFFDTSSAFCFEYCYFVPAALKSSKLLIWLVAIYWPCVVDFKKSAACTERYAKDLSRQYSLTPRRVCDTSSALLYIDHASTSVRTWRSV